jgi:hypothetical protein
MRKKYILIEIQELKKEVPELIYPAFAKKGLQRKRYKEAMLDALERLETRIQSKYFI